ncbi:hypothetical protein B296_00011593 [Ensete ventricosum]|uniref:Uncharacterized protein n=1 Tax=Ensete ventricosum TaxID=4639 RepID=A0A426ZCH0_ENSVE|nr:hypothetical protein B296_00011593 [Ensete ventricosum]
MIGSLMLLKRPLVGLAGKQDLATERENLTAQPHLSQRSPYHQLDPMGVPSVQFVL